MVFMSVSICMYLYGKPEHLRPAQHLAWTPDGSVLFGLAPDGGGGGDHGDDESETESEAAGDTRLWAVSCGCVGLLFHSRDPVLVRHVGNRPGSDWTQLMFSHRTIMPR